MKYIIGLAVIVLIIFTVISVAQIDHENKLAYNATLPNNAIRFNIPNVPYRVVYTNDYEIICGILIVHSYYAENISGKYKFIDEEVVSPQYTLYK